ncbi:hypothetical protein JB92DRAFT_2838747 [Gautieria morchelliformis]|nr:hypothetical protein JB92DRAFT_2838747 [Gautieria morchelliformis]
MSGLLYVKPQSILVWSDLDFHMRFCHHSGAYLLRWRDTISLQCKSLKAQAIRTLMMIKQALKLAQPSYGHTRTVEQFDDPGCSMDMVQRQPTLVVSEEILCDFQTHVITHCNKPIGASVKYVCPWLTHDSTAIQATQAQLEALLENEPGYEPPHHDEDNEQGDQIRDPSTHLQALEDASVSPSPQSTPQPQQNHSGTHNSEQRYTMIPLSNDNSTSRDVRAQLDGIPLDRDTGKVLFHHPQFLLGTYQLPFTWFKNWACIYNNLGEWNSNIDSRHKKNCHKFPTYTFDNQVFHLNSYRRLYLKLTLANMGETGSNEKVEQFFSLFQDLFEISGDAIVKLILQHGEILEFEILVQSKSWQHLDWLRDATWQFVGDISQGSHPAWLMQLHLVSCDKTSTWYLKKWDSTT